MPSDTEQALNCRLDEVLGKLQDVEAEIQVLYSQQEELERERSDLQARIEQVQVASTPQVDYDMDSGFPWSAKAADEAHDHWGIKTWRGVQRPVINAAMSGKDVLAILPTGAGKSLCYQLPAILATAGQITLVVSPLVSLIHDQVHHLREARVHAIALTASATKEQVAFATAVLSKGEPVGEKDPVRLIYVTPERVAMGKRFISALEKCYRGGRLGRIVIDECHCCSQLGHDFRPDYKKLGILRTAFPSAPIMALSATCPPTVLSSVVEILGLTPPGKRNGALLFTMPLYRPNLRYSVLPKPASASEVVNEMGRWIWQHWPEDRGIIYCATRKEVEVLALGLREIGIASGAYHSDVDDGEKVSLHRSWRLGGILVIVATTAFGMGIDQPNVRYVLHHSPSRSLDAYYQETGRGGRDGGPTDCVLWYRARDMSRLTAMGVTEQGGLRQVYSMIRYIEDGWVCRKWLFDRYFDRGDLQGRAGMSDGVVCGHCDVCLRQVGGRVLTKSDIRDAARDVCVVARMAAEDEPIGGRITAVRLASLWMRPEKKMRAVDAALKRGEWKKPDRICTTEEAERLIVRLLLDGYLREDFHFTAYSTISYIVVTSKGEALAGLAAGDISALGKPILLVSLDQDMPSTLPAKRDRDSVETSLPPKKRTSPHAKKEVVVIFDDDVSDQDVE